MTSLKGNFSDLIFHSPSVLTSGVKDRIRHKWVRKVKNPPRLLLFLLYLLHEYINRNHRASDNKLINVLNQTLRAARLGPGHFPKTMISSASNQVPAQQLQLPATLIVS